MFERSQNKFKKAKQGAEQYRDRQRHTYVSMCACMYAIHTYLCFNMPRMFLKKYETIKLEELFKKSFIVNYRSNKTKFIIICQIMREV